MSMIILEEELDNILEAHEEGKTLEYLRKVLNEFGIDYNSVFIVKDIESIQEKIVLVDLHDSKIVIGDADIIYNETCKIQDLSHDGLPLAPIELTLLLEKEQERLNLPVSIVFTFKDILSHQHSKA